MWLLSFSVLDVMIVFYELWNKVIDFRQPILVFLNGLFMEFNHIMEREGSWLDFVVL